MSIKARVIGRIGKVSDVKQAGQSQVMNISVAANYGRKDASGERPTQWIDAAMWGDRASKVQPFLTVGSQHAFDLEDVHIETYTKGDGTTGVKLAAVVQDITLLSSKGDRQEKPAAKQPAKDFDEDLTDLPF